MSVHLHRELDRLRGRLLGLAGEVEQQLQKAITAVLNRDPQLADEVEAGDRKIDQYEVELEEECLKVLALYQPVAADLRFLITVLKINNDLERVGDLAVNIARKARTLSQMPPVRMPFDLDGMWRKVQAMLRQSVDSLVNGDAGAAEDVCKRDEAVNAQKKAIRQQVEQLIEQHPDQVKTWLQVLAVSRNLERVADHATNIAEDVIYLVRGHIVRHPARFRDRDQD
ncbi:MAG: phosphate signaling complex protein PhoU [Thermogutta sp.]|uniref:phosphate signaling complex protein PhoU n=1 Tax=Thermogutta sp. TaxID=1962930 RepID=UPI0019A7284A|nr:phosphate signaling complex protein PhoU [Thermogutta sp.]MBC7354233.1 phosphate signaling complex protein PhoU [Thermogutta sp.]